MIHLQQPTMCRPLAADSSRSCVQPPCAPYGTRARRGWMGRPRAGGEAVRGRGLRTSCTQVLDTASRQGTKHARSVVCDFDSYWTPTALHAVAISCVIHIPSSRQATVQD